MLADNIQLILLQRQVLPPPSGYQPILLELDDGNYEWVASDRNPARLLRLIRTKSASRTDVFRSDFLLAILVAGKMTSLGIPYDEVKDHPPMRTCIKCSKTLDQRRFVSYNYETINAEMKVSTSKTCRPCVYARAQRNKEARKRLAGEAL